MAAELTATSRPAVSGQAGARPGGLLVNTLGVIAGAAFTLALFLGMARYASLAPVAPAPGFADLRAVAAPLEPPPPPPTEILKPQAGPLAGTITGFDFAPSDSPVKIAVSPPDPDAVTSGIRAAPTAVISIGRLVGDFKPQADDSILAQRIYQKSEVDRPPMVLYRNIPSIPPLLVGYDRPRRVTLLLIIDATGAVSDVRVARSCGEPELDQLMVDNIKTWGFSPAIKKGRKVRCLIEQQYILTRGSGSHFET